jgi:cellulose synthase operon protein C
VHAGRAQGLALLIEAADQLPRAPGVHWHLAQAQVALGHRAEAKLAAQAALALPGFGERVAAQALVARL